MPGLDVRSLLEQDQMDYGMRGRLLNPNWQVSPESGIPGPLNMPPGGPQGPDINMRPNQSPWGEDSMMAGGESVVPPIIEEKLFKLEKTLKAAGLRKLSPSEMRKYAKALIAQQMGGQPGGMV